MNRFCGVSTVTEVVPGASSFLAVWAEPGACVTLEEFHDWYDNEHIPLRLNQLSSFLTGARFRASDGLCPSWLAVYDIQEMSVFNDDRYTRLRTHRSVREADLMRRLHTLDRRTYELIHDTGESNQTSSLGWTNPTQVLTTHGIAWDDDVDLKNRWELDYLPSLKAVKGWVRTRVYRCVDSLKIGIGLKDSPDEHAVPRYLVVHELLNNDCVESFRVAFNAADLATVIVEYREWGLHRAYPSLSQTV